MLRYASLLKNNRRAIKMSQFIKHTPCEHCGSSDAGSLYSDHWVCFSCNTRKGKKKESKTTMTKNSKFSLLKNLSYQNIPNRKLKVETLQKYGAGLTKYSKLGKVVVFPYFKNRQLVAQHIRSATKEFRWIGTTDVELYGQGLYSSDKYDTVIITEGEYDCLSLAQYAKNIAVVSIPLGVNSADKHIKANIEWLEGFKTIMLCFDNDEPGLQASKKCATLFSPGKAKIVNLAPYKDPNDFLMQGKQRELFKAINNAQPFQVDGLVSGEKVRERLREYWQGDIVGGWGIQYPKFNEVLKGVKQKRIYLFTAGTGVGKSTLVNELAYHIKTKHNLKLGVIALEESVEESAMRFISLHLNKRIEQGELKSQVTMQEIEKSYEEVVKDIVFYDHFGSLNAKKLLSKMRFMVKACGVEVLVFDHISIAVSGEETKDERKYIDMLMTKLRQLVEETKVTVFLICHLKRKEGKSPEEGGKVYLSDLRGSGALGQISDYVVALERDTSNEDTEAQCVSRIKVLKNRVNGKTHYCDYLKYCHKTGRMNHIPKEEAEDLIGRQDKTTTRRSKKIQPNDDF